MRKVSIIIVNYNTGHLVRACIESVLKQVKIEKEIIVVDNASSDNSAEILQAYGDKLRLLCNQENVGFGRANNQAAKLATGDYLFLLNPDAVFQEPLALKRMLEFMQDNPHFGLSGTQVVKMQAGGYSAPQYRYPGQKYTAVDFSQLPGDIAWVIGASMMVKREVFERVQGFDEAFFLYGEEADLCLSVRKAGYAIGYNPTVLVNHVGGGSEQKTDIAALWRKKQGGLHVFIEKNYPLPEAVKIVLQQNRRAKRRLFFLRLYKLAGMLNESRKNRYERYRVVAETSEDFLQKHLMPIS